MNVLNRALHAVVARALADSPRARELLESLAGRCLEIDISGTRSVLSLTSTGSTLQIVARTGEPARTGEAPTGEPAPDARIIGAPLSLLALTGSQPEAVIQRGDVRIEGDTEIAQRFRELAALLPPDPEALLAMAVGRVGAHGLMRALRGSASWTRRTAWTGVRNLTEYLAYESGTLLSRAEAEHFLRGVDELREQFDRLEARAAHLARLISELRGGATPSDGARPGAAGKEPG